jgi:hypothetical protein
MSHETTALMEHDLIAQLDAQPDTVVLAGAERLAANHHRNVADLVAHVAVVDSRLLFAPRFSSLFRYCCGALRLTEGAAANLIETARAARRYPLILALLRDGSINPTTVRVLASVLSAENHAEILREAMGRSKLEVQAIAARLRPAPDVTTSLRRVADTTPTPMPPGPSLFDSPSSAQTPPPPVPYASAPGPVAAPPARSVVAPLSPARYSYKLTIDDDMRRLLLQARELMSHAIHGGDDLEVLKRALDLFVRQQLKRRFGLASRPAPRTKAAKKGSRHVPVRLARAVYERDGGGCAWVGPDGVRCGERHLLQLHHLKPWAVGGEATVENLALRCALHNRHEARLYFARPDLLPSERGPDRGLTDRQPCQVRGG